MMIRFHHVSKMYGGTSRLEPLDLEIQPHKTTILMGPSGCGKSTVLRLIAGLIEPSTGRIEIDGHRLSPNRLQEFRRRMGFVIQNGDLFPHMTALQNVRLVA